MWTLAAFASKRRMGKVTDEIRDILVIQRAVEIRRRFGVIK